MEHGTIHPYPKFLVVFVVIVGITWGAFPAAVEGFFDYGSDEYTWPSRIPIYLPIIGQAIEPDDLGYTYVWEYEILANGWFDMNPGFSYGISTYPPPSGTHHVGMYSDQWAYHGLDGTKFSANINTPWGPPIGDVGDRIRLVFDTEAGTLTTYLKPEGESEFILPQEGPMFSGIELPEGKIFRPVVTVACIAECKIKAHEPDFSLDLAPAGAPFTGDPVKLFQVSEQFTPRLDIDEFTVTITNGKPGDVLTVFGDETDSESYDSESYRYVMTNPELDEVLEVLRNIRFDNPNLDGQDRIIEVAFDYKHYLYNNYGPKNAFEKTMTLAVEEPKTAGFFANGGWEFTWPSQLPVHLPAVGKAIGADELGYTYVWDLEIVANEWYVNVPGFNFGVTVEPLYTVVHELGQLSNEWAYRGIDGQKFSNNELTPWGDPIGDVGDHIRFVFDTAAGSLWVYTKKYDPDEETEFVLQGEPFTDILSQEEVEMDDKIEGFRPIISAACAGICTIKAIQPELFFDFDLVPTGEPFTGNPVHLFHDFDEQFTPRVEIEQFTVTITNGKPGDKLIVFGDAIDSKYYDDETYQYVMTNIEYNVVLEALRNVQFFSSEIDDEEERTINVEIVYSHYIYYGNPDTFEKTITLTVEQPTVAVDHFLIEAESGGPIENQQAGHPFNIRVVALDADGQIVPEFTGTVDVMASGEVSAGAGTSAPFVNGVLESHAMTFTEAGQHTISVALTGGDATGTSDPFEVKAAATAKLGLSEPEPHVAGGARTLYTLTRYDAFGNKVTDGEETFYLFTTSIGAGAAFYDSVVGGHAITEVTIADGSSTMDFWYADEAAGTWTLTATDNPEGPDGLEGIADAVHLLEVEPGTVSGIAVTHQPGDAVAGLPFAQAPVVTTVDAYGNPSVKGLPATLRVTATWIGNGDFHETSTTTLDIGADKGNGSVIFSNLRIDVAQREGQIKFTTSDGIVSEAFSGKIAVRHAPADHLVTVAPDGEQTAGVPFNLVAIKAVDAFGNLADGADGATVYSGEKNVTYTLSGMADGPLSGTDSFTTTVTFVDGVSTTPLTTVLYRAQTTTITASDPELPGVVSDVASSAVTIKEAEASRLVVTTQPTGVQAGQPFETQPIVKSVDAFGNLSAVGLPDSLTVTATWNGDGAFHDTSIATVDIGTAAGSGVAAFANLRVDRAQSDATITFVAADDALATVTSNPLNVLHAEADYLVTIAPVGEQTAGVPFNLVSVTAFDAFGNVANGANGAVSYEGPKSLIYTLSGIANGPESGTDSFTTDVTFVNGVATSMLSTTLYRAQQTTVTASDPDLPNTAANVASDLITVNPAGASRIAFTVEPSQTVAGEAIAPAVEIALFDPYGNPATEDGVEVTLALASGDGVLSGDTQQSTVNGVASFGDLAVEVIGSKTLSVSADGLTGATSQAFTIVSGPPAVAGSSVQADPASGVTADGSSQSTVTLTVRDAFGNPITGLQDDDFHVELTGSAVSGDVNESGTPGTYTFTVTNTVAEDVTLTVKAGGVRIGAADGVTITFVPGPISVGPNGSLLSGTDLTRVADGVESATISVQIRDKHGNEIAQDGVAVTFATTGGTLSSTSVTTDTDGLARVTLTSTRVEEVDVTAQVEGVGAVENGSPVQVSFISGKAASLRFVEHPTDAIAGETIAPAVTVEVLDAHGNRVTWYNDEVKVAIGNDAGNPDADLRGTIVVNAVSGLATFSDLYIETAGVGYTLLVQDANEKIDAVESDPLTITPAGADAGKSEVSVAKSQLTADGKDSTTITVTVKDAYGNVRTQGGDAVFITTTAGTLDDGSASGSALSAQDHGNGTFTITLTGSTDASESALISAYLGMDAEGDLIGTVTVEFVPGAISVGANGSLLYGADLTRVADGVEAATISVQLRDEYGNEIAQEGVPITFATSGGTLSATSMTTDPGGFAQVTLTSTSAEEVEVTATVDLGGPIVSAITNGSPVRVKFVPGKPTTLRLVNQPTDAIAGIAIAPPVTVEVLDAHGNRVTGYTGAIKVAIENNAGNPEGQLSGNLTAIAVDGLATFDDLFIDKTGQGYTLAVQDDEGKLPAAISDAFDITPAAADPGKSTIHADPAGITTDETATITVQLKDAYGNNLVSGGDAVLFDADRGELTSVQDHGDGTYSASFSATTPGVGTITAKVNGVAMADRVQITVSVGAADATTSTISVDHPSITTDETATITVQLKDAHGNDLTSGGDAVALDTDHGDLISIADNGDGTYTAIFNATTPGVATITAKVNGVAMSDSVQITVSVGVADATTSTMTVDRLSITTDDTANITVQLKDAHGNDLASGGDTVELATDHGDLTSVKDNGDGTYTATFSAATPVAATITGKVNGVAMSDSVQVTVSVGMADASTSTLTVDRPSITTDDTAAVTVQLKDAHGNDITSGGDAVAFDTDHGDLTPVEDNGDGTYTVVLSATTPGVATITGKVNGVAMADSVQVTVSVGEANATTSTISVDLPSITTDETATITVQLKDAHGNNLISGGDTVELATVHGDLTTAKDNGDGTYTATFSATAPGVATITATVNGVALADSVQVTVSVGVADATTSIITVDLPSITTDETAVITVRLKDAHGNDLISGGDTVELATVHGDLTSVKDNGDGTYTTTFSATTPGMATITGKVNGVAMADSVQVTVSVGVADATTSIITVDRPSITTDETVTITVQLKDAYGNNLISGGDEVLVDTDHGDLTAIDDNGDGTYTATFSATTPGVATVTAKVNGVTVADSVQLTVSVGAADAGTSTIEVTPSQTTIGGEGARVIVRLYDAHGNPMGRGGENVEILSDHGDVRDVTDEGDGTYSATLIALVAGTAQVTARINEVELVDSATVEFQDHSVADTRLLLSQSVTPRFSTPGDVLTFTIIVENASDHTINEIDISNYFPDGLEYVDGSASGPPMSQMVTLQSNEYDSASRTLSWTIPTLEPGKESKVQFTFQATVLTVGEGTMLPNLVTAQQAGTVAVASSVVFTTVGTWPDLKVEKRADQTEVSIGSSVRYRVTVENQNTGAASVTSHDTQLVDVLPVGFVYVEGSTRMNGAAASDPTSHGGQLVWDLGTMNPGEHVTVEYVTTVSLDATLSDGVNTVQVIAVNPGGYAFDTDPVTAEVKVRPGLFGSLGTLTGLVYLDLNDNGQKDPEEPGLAGVTLYMDDGQRVVTDEMGRYSITGLYPGLRSMKVIGYSTGDSSQDQVEDATAFGLGSGARGSVGSSIEQSKFVMIPVGGVAVENFGLPLATVVTDSVPGKIPTRLVVGTVDFLIPADGSPELRYGAVFGRWENEADEIITVRHREISGEDPAELQGVWPQHPLIGDDSTTTDLAPGMGSTFIRLEEHGKALTYGIVTPEARRANTFASRTSPFTGFKWESESESGEMLLTAYLAQVTGDEHIDRFDELGMTGPYYLSHAPIALGTAVVWLVTHSGDPGVGEMNRIRLIEGIDYTLEPEYGVIWLRHAPAGVDENFNSRYLEVVYRTKKSGVVGEIVGVRADADTPWGPVGLSYSREIRNSDSHRVIGIDGKVSLGKNSYLAYEVGAGQLGDDTDSSSGVGARVQAGTSLTDRLKWTLAGQWVEGILRPPGRSELKEGTEITSAFTYRFSDRAELVYERGYTHALVSSTQHSDKVKFSTRLDSRSGSAGLRLEAGIESKGKDVVLSPDRRTRVHTGIGWTWGERLRLNLAAGLQAESDQNWKLSIPTEASMRVLRGNLLTSIGYRQTFGQDDSGMWVASMESAPQGGLSAYTRFSTNGESSQWTLGARQGWALTDDLKLSLGAEGRRRSTGSGMSSDRTAVVLNATYQPDDGKSRATLVHEMEHSDAGTRHITRAAWNGRWDLGWSLRIGGSLISGPKSVNDSRRVLQDELSLAVDYRDSLRSRHTLLGQLIMRGYEQQGSISMGDVQSRVDIAGVDYGFRWTDTIGIHAKAAIKRERTRGVPASQSSLTQMGLDVGITKRLSLEVFQRHLWDSAGASLSGRALELVYRVSDDLGISVGTSTLGVKDPDMALVAPWPEGVYYRVRLKF